MGRIIKLTESDLIKIVKRVINEEETVKHRKILSDIGGKIYKLFIEYLKQNPNTTYNDTTIIKQHLEKLKTITENDVSDVFNFFKSKGYGAKNSDVMTFQKDLGIEEFKTPQGEKEFADGTFGMATALAAIQFFITFYSNILNSYRQYPNFTYGQSRIEGRKTGERAKEGEIEKIQQKIDIDKPISINTSTQSTK